MSGSDSDLLSYSGESSSGSSKSASSVSESSSSLASSYSSSGCPDETEICVRLTQGPNQPEDYTLTGDLRTLGAFLIIDAEYSGYNVTIILEWVAANNRWEVSLSAGVSVPPINRLLLPIDGGGLDRCDPTGTIFYDGGDPEAPVDESYTLEVLHFGSCEGSSSLSDSSMVDGCTNPYSPNYNPTASIDDGSCETCENMGLCIIPDPDEGDNCNDVGNGCCDEFCIVSEDCSPTFLNSFLTDNGIYYPSCYG